MMTLRPTHRRSLLFPPFRLDMDDERLWNGPDAVPLRPKSFAVLRHLAERSGQLITKEDLLAAIWPGTAVGEAGLAVCIRELREALGDTPGDPHYIQTVHRRGYRFIAPVNADLQGPAPAPEDLEALPRMPALHQLPPTPEDFAGRMSELAELKAAVEAGAAILGIRGMGGAGKTTLALRFAEILAPSYPDGLLFLDLQGVTPQPLTPADAMIHTIRSFYPGGRPPQGEPELRAAYHSTLHGKRTLLLLDNAASAEQVAPLIPSRGNLLLITSRPRLALPGLHALDLGGFPAEDARALLLRIAPRIAQHADALAQMCGFLPLALRLTGAALSERIDIDPRDYLERMRDGESRPQQMDQIDSSLGLSYEMLAAEHQALWRRLAVFSDSFAADAVAAVWELSLERTREVLSELLRYNLVAWNSETLRYRLHDLARLCANARMDPAERDSARLRHADYYLAVLKTAAGLYGGESLREGLGLFDAEWPNIRAGQRWAEENISANGRVARLLSSVTKTHDVLAMRLDSRELLRFAEVGLKAVRSLGDHAQEAPYLGGLGLAHYDLGDVRRAINLHEQQLIIAQEFHSRREEASALLNLARCHYALGELNRALDLLQQTSALVLGSKFQWMDAYVLEIMGRIHLARGWPRRAIELHEQALAIARQIGDCRKEGVALSHLGCGYRELRDLHRARAFHEQALAIARQIDDQRGEGMALGQLGLDYSESGEPGQAVPLHEQELAIAHALGRRRSEGTALGHLGLAYQALGEDRRAIDLLGRWRTIASEGGDRRQEANACWYLGLAYAREGDAARAVTLMKRRVDYEREIGHADLSARLAMVESVEKTTGARAGQ